MEPRDLLLAALDGRQLHISQNIADEEKSIKRFMVLSRNYQEPSEFFIEGFSDDFSGALVLVNKIDPEWVLQDVFDLFAIAIGKDVRIEIVRGAKAFIDGVETDPVWEE